MKLIEDLLVVVAFLGFFTAGVMISYGWKLESQASHPTNHHHGHAHRSPSQVTPKKDQLGALSPSLPTQSFSPVFEGGKVLESWSFLFEELSKNKDITLEQMTDFLKSQKQEPRVLKSENPHTGGVLQVRTDDPWPNSKNLMAQFFLSQGQPQELSSLSFEIRPQEDILMSAKTFLEEQFGGKISLIDRSEHHVVYQLGEAYHVNLVVLDQNRIQHSAFFAYTDQDVGALRVTIESSANSEHI